MRVLITSGGTRQPIDDVRYITNSSTGDFASKIASEFLFNKSKVHFLHAKNSEKPFAIKTDFFNDEKFAEKFYEKYKFYECHKKLYSESLFDSYDSYSFKLHKDISDFEPQIVILVAAVSDFGVEKVEGKITSSESQTLQLNPLPKVIKNLKSNYPNIMVVGFKLVVNKSKSELLDIMSKSLTSNNCDLVVGNDLYDIKQGNHILLVKSNCSGKVSVLEEPSERVENLCNIIATEYKKYF